MYLQIFQFYLWLVQAKFGKMSPLVSLCNEEIHASEPQLTISNIGTSQTIPPIRIPAQKRRAIESIDLSRHRRRRTENSQQGDIIMSMGELSLAPNSADGICLILIEFHSH